MNANHAFANALGFLISMIGMLTRILSNSKIWSPSTFKINMIKLQFFIVKTSKCSTKEFKMLKKMGTPITKNQISAIQTGTCTHLLVWEGTQKSCTEKWFEVQKRDYNLGKLKRSRNKLRILTRPILWFGLAAIKQTLSQFMIRVLKM